MDNVAKWTARQQDHHTVQPVKLNRAQNPRGETEIAMRQPHVRTVLPNGTSLLRPRHESGQLALCDLKDLIRACRPSQDERAFDHGNAK